MHSISDSWDSKRLFPDSHDLHRDLPANVHLSCRWCSSEDPVLGRTESISGMLYRLFTLRGETAHCPLQSKDWFVMNQQMVPLLKRKSMLKNICQLNTDLLPWDWKIYHSYKLCKLVPLILSHIYKLNEVHLWNKKNGEDRQHSDLGLIKW